MPSIPKMELSSFSSGALLIIRAAREAANAHRAFSIGSEDLLAGAAKSETKVGEVLREHGVTYGEVLSCCHFSKLPMPESKKHLDETDLASNFASDGKRVLGNTLIKASYRDNPSVTERDIIDELIGCDHTDTTSYQIVQRLGLDPSEILRATAARSRVQTQVVTHV
jgi:hypothetical protein